MNLEELAKKFVAEKLEPPQSMLIYGPPKSGKTVLAAQLARHYHLHYFDCDGGYEALFGAVPKEFWKNITLYRVYDTPTAPNAVALATKVFGSAKPVNICEEHGSADCAECLKAKKAFQVFDKSKLTTRDVVVWDSGTQLSASAMNQAIGKLGELDYRKKEFGHYDQQGLFLSNILAYQKRMPCHRVMITHEQNLALTSGEKKIIPVLGTSNFARQCAKDFGHVVYAQLKNNKHSIITGTLSNSNIGAGSRSNLDIKDGTELYKLFGAEAITNAVTNLSYTTSEEEKEPDIEIPVEEAADTVVPAIVNVTVQPKATPERPLTALEKLRAAQKP